MVEAVLTDQGLLSVNRDSATTAEGVVVVVDVLRAFTTASIAAAGGARRFFLVSDIDEAFALRDIRPSALLMGEDGGFPIAGFDLSNSPVEVFGANVSGREIIHRSSSGTRAAVDALQGASRLYCASFISAVATAQAIGTVRPTYVISGNSIERSAFDNGDDDLAVAEHIESIRTCAPQKSDVVERIIFSPAAERLRSDGIAEHDIRACASRIHGPALVASFENGVLRLDPVEPRWGAPSK